MAREEWLRDIKKLVEGRGILLTDNARSMILSVLDQV
jgi:hypothetical protein